MSTIANLQLVCTGMPRDMLPVSEDDAGRKTWRSGIVKEPRPGPIWVGTTGLAGDGQADLSVHGGPDKAINVYPKEHYVYWRTTRGYAALGDGAFGENFSTEGLHEETVAIGDIFQVGDAVLQVSQPRRPCWKLARRWGIKDLALQVESTGLTGWYFRVLQEGAVEQGVAIKRLEQASPSCTVAQANNAMHGAHPDSEAFQRLMACPALSESWKTTLANRRASR